MATRRWAFRIAAVFLLFLATNVATADRLILKDGTVLEGKVIQQSDQYWVKTTDGDTRIVPATQVQSYVKSQPAVVKPPTPAPKADAPSTHGPKPGPTTTPAPVAPPPVVAAPPPPSVTISVPATHAHANPVATGVKLKEGEQFTLTPNPQDMWSKGDGPAKGKKCDYKGSTSRPGWMSLSCQVGKGGVDVEAGTKLEAPESGEVLLYCTDDSDASKNEGAIRVTIVGPFPPAIGFVQRKVEAVEKASDAVAIWNEYLASHPADPDLSQAKTELAKWLAMDSGGAEKINGKWISGQEHKTMMEKAGAKMKEAREHFAKNESIQAVKAMEEAQAIYPNSYIVNFFLGYIAFTQNDVDKAMPLFERALKIHPKSPEAMANIGLIHFKRNECERGILEVQQAAELGDSMEIAIDLNVLVTTAPDPVKSSDKIKGAISDAKLLASKYGLPMEFIPQMKMLPVPMRESGGSEGEPPPGSQSSGTGFVINSDGLILTNRHVAKGGKTFEVTLQGGEKLPAEVVVIDDEQDLALIRVKPTKALPTVKFADHDAPGDGADCTVIGFPLGDRYTANPKVTHGIVTTGHANTEGADVMIDAKVNPGNSGGPILDKNGDVMAIVCMKSLTTQTEDSYGLGISTGKIRKFLDKNKIKTTKASGKASAALTAEEIAEKVEPMTVLIVTTH